MQPSATDHLRERWDQRYREVVESPSPALVLSQNAHLLPVRGMALDLACGLGANALFLAARGLQTWAWDFSAVAIERLRAKAREQGLALQAQIRDVERDPPEVRRFDVIIVTHFLERTLAKPLMEALKPGGLLFYQTFTQSSVDEVGPRNNAYRLGDNELLQMFSKLQLVCYREEGRIGDTSCGFRNEAMLVGMRRNEMTYEYDRKI